MRTCATALLAALLAAWPVLSVQAADAKADDARIAELVKALGADDFRARQRAQEQLSEIGPPAIPALEKALAETSDPEVKLRAGQILPDLRKQAAKLLAAKIKENVLWTVPVPQAGAGRLIAAGGCVLVPGADGRITAVDTAAHKVRWRKAARKDVPPLVLGDTAWLVDPEGKLGAIDLATGKPRDGFKTWTLAGTPGLAGGVIYAPCNDKKLRALDARTGKAKWQADIEDVGGFGPAPVFLDSEVVLSLGGGRTLAADRATGKGRWKWMTTSPGARALAVSGDVLLVRIADRVYGLDGARGTPRWSTNLGNVVQRGAIVRQVVVINGKVVKATGQTGTDAPGMAVADGTVYLVAGGQLQALKTDNGLRKLMHANDDEKKQADNPNVANLRGGVAQIGGQAMVKIQIQGAPAMVAAAQAQARGLSEPLVDGHILYYGSGKGLRAADRATGESLWLFDAPGGVSARPVIAGGVIYFLAAGESDQAKLYAVRLRESP